MDGGTTGPQWPGVEAPAWPSGTPSTSMLPRHDVIDSTRSVAGRRGSGTPPRCQLCSDCGVVSFVLLAARRNENSAPILAPGVLLCPNSGGQVIVKISGAINSQWKRSGTCKAAEQPPPHRGRAERTRYTWLRSSPCEAHAMSRAGCRTPHTPAGPAKRTARRLTRPPPRRNHCRRRAPWPSCGAGSPSSHACPRPRCLCAHA